LTLVTLADIQAAAERVRGLARRTPLVEAPPLLLKSEHLQPMGAFKIRGAVNMLAQLPPSARAAGVITYSSGNHGQAVALAAQRLGATAVVVMPETAPQVKIDGVRRYGADVIIAGRTSQDRKDRAEAEAAARGLTIVPPFDHPWIVAGAGTCGLEIIEECPDVATVYVPVGGGGLIAGVATAVKTLRPGARVVGVEPIGAAKMAASRLAGHPVPLARTESIADGLLPLRPGDLTFAHVQAFVDDLITVTEAQIAAAVGWLADKARVRAEPSGAVSVAGALLHPSPGSTVAVISGGNVSPAAHAALLQSLPPPS
jgi:threonine dehydratase